MPQAQKSNGGRDAWLVRTDKDGNLVWNRTYGGTKNETAYDVSVAPDGGLLMVGVAASADLPQGQKVAGGEDAWVLRTDANGNLLWNRTFGGMGHSIRGTGRRARQAGLEL